MIMLQMSRTHIHNCRRRKKTIKLNGYWHRKNSPSGFQYLIQYVGEPAENAKWFLGSSLPVKIKKAIKTEATASDLRSCYRIYANFCGRQILNMMFRIYAHFADM